jgi:hypothetical protein
MLNDEIASFREQRRPDRFYPASDPTKPGRPKPLHPIVIEGIGRYLCFRHPSVPDRLTKACSSSTT